MSIEEMAKAHLQNVHKTIIELEQQKLNIEQEIFKLTEYLKAGNEELLKSKQQDKQ